MIITKKQSKNLRYFARANYKSECKGVETENGKVKHREFPCFELAYDESKATAGNVELTNVTIGGKPFDGDYTALMTRLRELLDNSDDVCAEELEQDKTLTEQAMDAVKDKSDTIVIAEKPQVAEKPLGVLDPIPSGLIKNAAECLEALAPSYENYPPKEPASVADIPEEVKESVLETAETVTTLVYPEMQVVSKEIKDLSEDGTLTVDVKAVANNPVDSVDVHIDVNKLKANNAQEDTVGASESAKFVEEHEAPVLEVNAQNVETPVIENVEEAKQVAEETGTPVITAEQKPKKTRAELYDLQIKCATMRLATSYGEPPETDIGSLMKKYPDAVEKLNALYAADGIKTYTITEDAIKQAYPDEYAALC